MVRIGTQVWMKKNLNVDKFRNGDLIPHAKSNEEWQAAGRNQMPAWCYYENDPSNGTRYGKLYNWYAVIDSRGLAPHGWHIPSDAEWTQLTDFLGGEAIAGKKMKSSGRWKNNGNGSNESRFSGFPGGFRYGIGTFDAKGYYGNWWSSTESNLGNAWDRNLGYGLDSVGRYNDDKKGGFSVRCLKD